MAQRMERLPQAAVLVRRSAENTRTTEAREVAMNISTAELFAPVYNRAFKSIINHTKERWTKWAKENGREVGSGGLE